MSGLTGKGNLSIKRGNVKETQYPVGVKSLKFAHKFTTGGETSIDFGALNTPTEMTGAGFVQPTSSEIIAANLSYYKDNVRVFSSLNGELLGYLTYTLRNSSLTFVNGYTGTINEIIIIEFTQNVITGNPIVDARALVSTGTLSAGYTEYNVGEAFTVNKNPTEQIGEVVIFIDGTLQFRNVNNATASPTADGNYQEIAATGGLGSIIKMNNATSYDRVIAVYSMGLIAERPNLSTMQYVETLAGQLDKVIETVAANAGVEKTVFQSAPNNIDLANFGTIVQQMLSAEVPIQTDWISFTPVTQGLGTILNVEAFYKQVGDTYLIQGTLQAGTVTGDEIRIGLPNSKTVSSNITSRMACGLLERQVDSNIRLPLALLGGNNYLTVGVAGTGANFFDDGNSTGTGLLSSNNYITFNATVPIEGLKGTQTIREQLGL